MGIDIKDLPKEYQDQAERLLGKQEQKKHKYRNTKVEIDGIKFDSIREADRFMELRALQRAGEITDLKLQEEFVLQNAYRRAEDGKRVKELKYLADFTYCDKNGLRIIEDTKGVRTPVYQLKAKMMSAQGHDIKEV